MYMQAERRHIGVMQIARVINGIPSSENDSLHLNRVLGTEAEDSVGSILLFEEMRSGAQTADQAADQAALLDHPHAGFDILTVILNGEGRHRTAGFADSIAAGGAHWLTAGQGVSHGMGLSGSEARGFQIWLNLPSRRKQAEAVSRILAPSDIPLVMLPDAEVRVLAGQYHGLSGPVSEPATKPLILDIKLSHEGEVELALPAGHQGIVYAVQGGVAVEATLISPGQAGVLSAGAGDNLTLVAGKGGAHVILACTRPLDEPVVRYGPFVMNDHEAIKTAFTNYQKGLF